MKVWVGSIMLGIMVAFAAGCEGGWQFGGSASQINESGNWVDISGTYVPASAGSFLVSDYSAYSGRTTSTETLFVSEAGKTFYSGTVDVLNIDKNSVSGLIGDIGSFTISNTGVVGGGCSGTLNLTTGAFAITLGAPTTNVEYRVVFARNTGGNPASGPGGTGTISTFSVAQSGNAISIRDNNGAVYEGRIALTETNFVGSSSNTVMMSATYQYDASGVSQAGFNVELVGDFLINYAATSTNGSVTYGTFMSGTWIEQGGKTGHILGVKE